MQRFVVKPVVGALRAISEPERMGAALGAAAAAVITIWLTALGWWAVVLLTFVAILASYTFVHWVRRLASETLTRMRKAFKTWVLSSVAADVATLSDEIAKVAAVLDDARKMTILLLVAQAESSFRSGNAAETIELCNSALAIDGENPDALFSRGRAWARIGQPWMARADLDKYTKARPDHAEGFQRLAEVLLVLHQFDPAIDAAERARTLGAHRLAVGKTIGDAHLSAGRPDRAKAVYKDLLDDYPTDAKLVLGKGRALEMLVPLHDATWDAVFDWYETNAAKHPPAAAKYLAAEAEAYLRRGQVGDLTRALSCLYRAQAANPKETDVYECRANACFNQARNSALARDESAKLAWASKADADAATGYDRASRPYKPAFLNLRSRANLLLDDMERACQFAEKSVHERPDVPWNHIALVRALLWSNGGDEARPACRCALEESDFERAPAARVFVMFLNVATGLIQASNFEDVEEPTRDLVDILFAWPGFRAGLWSQWEETKELVQARVLPRVRNAALKSMLSGLIGVLEDAAKADDFSKRWLRPGRKPLT